MMILVTGGTGLIGSHLLYELTKQGKSVRALRRSTSNTQLVSKLFEFYNESPESQLANIKWIDGDVEDYQSLRHALKDVSEVYHCAALVSFDKRDQYKMLAVNVQGTANLVDASIEAGVKKFCHVSSVASLGSSVDDSAVDEYTVWAKSKGKSAYAVSKFRSEMEVWRGIQQGLNAVIVNPSVVIGPGRWDSGSGLLLGTIAKGFPFYTLGVTGYVDVRDVVNAILVAMEKQTWSKRFVLNGENLSHKEVFTIMAQEMGKKPPTIKVSPWMSSMAWPIAWLTSKITRKAPTLTRETAKSGHKKTYYSAKVAQEELGIDFTPISESIKNAVRAGGL